MLWIEKSTRSLGFLTREEFSDAFLAALLDVASLRKCQKPIFYRNIVCKKSSSVTVMKMNRLGGLKMFTESTQEFVM